MRGLSYKELKVGMHKSFSVPITTETIASFKMLSGDESPLHTDEEFAKSHGYDQCMSYGLLTASYLSRCVGMYLPGPNAMCQEISISFSKPVWPGDVLTYDATIVDLNDLFKRATLKVDITNQEGKKVARARVKAGLME